MKNNIIKKLIRLIAVFICIFIMLPVSTNANTNTYRDVDLSRWMSTMPYDTLISRINIPGSHDAGSYNPDCNNFAWRRTYATTQCNRIPEQLENGCRFLDIRLGAYSMKPYEDNYMYLCVNHGGYEARYEKTGNGRYLRFKDVLEEVNNFLASHDSETVVLFLQAEGGIKSAPKDKAKQMIKEKIKVDFAYDRTVRGRWDRFYFYPSRSDVPCLGQLKGKCVIICDEEDPKARTKYEDHCDVSKEDKYTHFSRMMNYIEKHPQKEKLSNIRGDKFEKDNYDNEAGKEGEPRIKLCYLSTNEAPNVVTGDSPKAAADYLFPEYKDEKKWKKETRYGWIPMDFVGREDSLPVIYNIICSNVGTTNYTVHLKDMALHGFTSDMIIIEGDDGKGSLIEIDKKDYKKYEVSFTKTESDITLKAKALPLYSENGRKYTYSVYLNAYGYDRIYDEGPTIDDKYIFIEGKWSARRQFEKIKITRETTKMPLEIQWNYEDETSFSEPTNVKEFFGKCDEIVLRQATKTDKDSEVRIDGKKITLNPEIITEFEKVSGEEKCYKTEITGLAKSVRETGELYEYDIKNIIFNTQSAKDGLRYVWSVKPGTDGVPRLVIDVRSDKDTVEVIGTTTFSDGGDIYGKRNISFDETFNEKEITLNKTTLDEVVITEKVKVEKKEEKNNSILFSGITKKYDENKDYYKEFIYTMPDTTNDGHYIKSEDENNEALYELAAPTDLVAIWNLADAEEIPEILKKDGVDVKLLSDDRGEESFTVSASDIEPDSDTKTVTWKSKTKNLTLFENNSKEFMYKIDLNSVENIRKKLAETGKLFTVNIDSYIEIDADGYPIRHVVVFCDSINTEKVCVTGNVFWNDGLLIKEHDTKSVIKLSEKVGESAATDISDKLKWDKETGMHFTATLPKAVDSKLITYNVEAEDVSGYEKVKIEDDDYNYRYTKLISVSVNGIPEELKDCDITLLRNEEPLSDKQQTGHIFNNLLISDENNNPYSYSVEIKGIGDYFVDYTDILTDEEGNVSIEAAFYKEVSNIEIPVRLDVQGHITNEEFEFVLGGITDKGMLRENIILNKENGFRNTFKVSAGELTDTEEAYTLFVAQVDKDRPGIVYDLHVSKIEAKVEYGNRKIINLEWKDSMEEMAGESIYVNSVDIIPATLKLDDLKHSISNPNKLSIPQSEFLYKISALNSDGEESILTLGTVTENGDGKAKEIKFDSSANPVEFYEAGTYTLYVSAVDMKETGYLYDTTAYEIAVTVSENSLAHNNLVITDKKYDSRLTEKNNTITHVFTMAEYCIPISSEIDGIADTDKQFTFIAKDMFNESNKKEVTITGAGQNKFPGFAYHEPGEYYYTVSEIVKHEDEEWIYDEKQFSYVVNVTRDDEGVLKAESETLTPTFINRYTRSTIPISVIWIGEKDEEGKKPYRPDKLDFTLMSEGKVIGNIRTIKGDKDADMWYYKSELLPIIKYVEGEERKIEYNTAVNMSEIADRYDVLYKGSARSGLSIICIEKELSKTEDVLVEIEWDDDDNKLGVRPEGVNISLSATPDYWHIEPVMTSSENEWKAVFSKLPMYCLDENERKCEITYLPLVEEDEEDNYEVSIVKNESTGVYTLKYALKGSLMLWAEPVDDMIYTGKQIKPDVKVHMGRKYINKGTDYSLKYSNNINVGKAKISVAGKGNYFGEDVTYFNIKQKDISDEDVTVSIADKKHTGNICVSKPVVKYGNITLKENRDYTVTYSGSQTEKGNVAVIIKGNGNYTGEKHATYRIYDKNLDFSKVYAEKIADQTYTGDPVTISANEIKIYTDKNKSKQLTAGEDFEIVYSKNVNVGTATAIVRGCGDYALYGGAKTVTFKIVKRPIDDAKIIVTGDRTYTGKTLTPSVIVKIGDKVLESKDYTVKYVNNKDVSDVQKGKKPTVVITGKGNYCGIASTEFNIIRKWLTEDDVKVMIPNIKDTGKVITEKDVKASVAYGKLKLTNKKDYTIEFNDDKTKSLQYVTLKLKGNYGGDIVSPVRVYSSIRQISISENTVINVSDCKYTGNEVKPKVSVIDTTSGKKISPGYYDVVYKNNVQVSDTLPEVIVKGKSLYCGDITGNFRIYQNDISKAFVENIVSQEYTGSQVKPVSEAINVYTDRSKTTKLSEGEHYFLEYGPNVKKGVGTVILNGMGNYGGKKTVRFLILPKKVIWVWF